MFFSDATSTQQFTAAEPGWSNAPYGKTFSATLDPATCGTGATAVASISPASGTTFTVTPQNAGFCKVAATDGVAQSAVLWISVTTASFGIN